MSSSASTTTRAAWVGGLGGDQSLLYLWLRQRRCRKPLLPAAGTLGGERNAGMPRDLWQCDGTHQPAVSSSPAPCPSPGSVEKRTCDFSWAGEKPSAPASTTRSSCVGYYSPKTTKPGNLSGCQETVLYGEWRPFTGTTAPDAVASSAPMPFPTGAGPTIASVVA